jgi:ATP-dependent Lon protease
MRWLWSTREAEAKDVSVTGVLDLRGRLGGVSGMEEKARAAKEDGNVRLLVMPEKNFRYWAANDFAKVRG